MNKRPPEASRWIPCRETLLRYGYDEETGDTSKWVDAMEAWAHDYPRQASLRKLFDHLTKAQLYSAALHLAALATGDYDQALSDGSAEERLVEELRCLGMLKKKDLIKS